MSIPPIGAVGSLNAIGLSGNTIGAADPIAPVLIPGIGVTGTAGTGGSATALDAAANNGDGTTESARGFAAQLADSLQSLQAMQTRKDELAVRAASGNLNDVHDYTIAATEASLATQLSVTVRDKAVAAFQEIMRMQ
ncbi:flagellar hook-basal body complex protein FliE [Cryptosporangium aurantiacum]|uniref:Flagellar hook-basal body complex protein FliE n=1 Tax=Cryptosporangium aurantiacum TaxID=134849 RepID=A0A1M7R6V0_9ACTN|nr:flagellar hook-basal body complex protein FliE [Cryptosporangium aurantiacum]SHN42014.1 flagellar hook-basal body complex protein FliE [Cryptosporangium aurantiacum]